LKEKCDLYCTKLFLFSQTLDRGREAASTVLSRKRQAWRTGVGARQSPHTLPAADAKHCHMILGSGGSTRRVLCGGRRADARCAQAPETPDERGDRPLTRRAAAQAEHQVQSGLLLDVVVGEGATVVELLALEDKELLVRGNALLVLDLLLNRLDRVRVVDIEGDGLVGKSLDEDLHRHLGGIPAGSVRKQGMEWCQGGKVHETRKSSKMGKN